MPFAFPNFDSEADELRKQLESDWEYQRAINRASEQRIDELNLEIARLKTREKKLKETLLPVCEYAAEIYNRGIPAIPMPDDTIQRLNFAFKMFGG